MLQVKKLPWAETYPLIAPMLPAHFEEVCWSRERFTLNPRLEVYEALEKADALHTWLLMVDGICVGYSLWFVQPNLHYRDTLWAANDLIYIQPEHRHEHTRWFVEATHDALRSLGVDGATYHMKTFKPFASLMHKVGAEHFENLYGIWFR
jgi:hypothetical protein